MSSKLTLRFFTVPEWEKEQDYLRSMHRKGWRFVRYTPLCFYRFESCEPEDVVYQLAQSIKCAIVYDGYTSVSAVIKGMG